MKKLSDLISDAEQLAIQKLLDEGYVEYSREIDDIENSERLDNEQLSSFGIEVSLVVDDTNPDRYWAKYSKIKVAPSTHEVYLTCNPHSLVICTDEQLDVLKQLDLVHVEGN